MTIMYLSSSLGWSLLLVYAIPGIHYLTLRLIWTGFELVVTWADRTVENTLEMAELENATPHEAEKWILHPVLSPYL